jgi:rhodanese-related sulfurtransferase
MLRTKNYPLLRRMLKEIANNPRQMLKPRYFLKQIKIFLCSTRISRIYPEELFKKVLSNSSSIKLIDIRNTEDYYGKSGHIKGAESIPLLDLIDDLNLLKDYKSKEFILICEIGRSSRFTAYLLAHAGHKKLRNLVGGMNSWYKKGYPTIRK